MAELKEYKGVKIFVNLEGVYYCNPETNSCVYKEKILFSEKLKSLEKAIDEYKCPEIDGNVYYGIDKTYSKLIPLKVVKHIGNLIFFDDLTNTSSNIRYLLYPKSIDETEDFKELQKLYDSIEENKKKMSELYKIEVDLRSKINEKLCNLNNTKVKPSV